jgi:hypothetical protein
MANATYVKLFRQFLLVCLLGCVGNASAWTLCKGGVIPLDSNHANYEGSSVEQVTAQFPSAYDVYYPLGASRWFVKDATHLVVTDPAHYQKADLGNGAALLHNAACVDKPPSPVLFRRA